MQPKVAYILPTIRPRFRKECIDSILNQTLTEWELYILDGNGSWEGHSDPRIKHYDVRNMIQSDAQNMAIKATKADVILTMCDDDVDMPTRAEECYNAIQSGIEYFQGSWNCMDESGKVYDTVFVAPPDYEQYIHRFRVMALWAGAYKKSVCPLFDDDFFLLADYVFTIECFKRGVKMASSNKVLANIRYWPGQMCSYGDAVRNMLLRYENRRICKKFGLDCLNR